MVESLILPSVDGYRSQRIDRHRRRCGGRSTGRFDCADDLDEPLDWIQPLQGLDRTLQIQRDVFVDHDVAEPRQQFERRDQIRRQPLIAAETPDGLAVLLEPVAASRGELAGDVLVDRINKQ